LSDGRSDDSHREPSGLERGWDIAEERNGKNLQLQNGAKRRGRLEIGSPGHLEERPGGGWFGAHIPSKDRDVQDGSEQREGVGKMGITGFLVPRGRKLTYLTKTERSPDGKGRFRERKIG